MTRLQRFSLAGVLLALVSCTPPKMEPRQDSGAARPGARTEPAETTETAHDPGLEAGAAEPGPDGGATTAAREPFGGEASGDQLEAPAPGDYLYDVKPSEGDRFISSVESRKVTSDRYTHKVDDPRSHFIEHRQVSGERLLLTRIDIQAGHLYRECVFRSPIVLLHLRGETWESQGVCSLGGGVQVLKKIQGELAGRSEVQTLRGGRLECQNVRLVIETVSSSATAERRSVRRATTCLDSRTGLVAGEHIEEETVDPDGVRTRWSAESVLVNDKPV